MPFSTKEEKQAYNKAYYQANKHKYKALYTCEHNRLKFQCKECGGSKICEHNRFKSTCKECGGSQICEHGRQKNACKECGGKSLCEHNIQKSYCKKCGGSSICEHNKRKHLCKDCGGSSICEHNRFKSQCKECGGSSVCEHNRFKSQCKECGGSQICEHNRIKSSCKECISINQHLVLLQRGSLFRILKSSNVTKTKPSIDYLGCSAEYFIEYLGRKMTDEMSWDNIHLDHIKPVSKFDLENMDELLDCCHYSNFQPLLGSQNISKSNKWNECDELFWNENIKGKEYMDLYIPN